MKKLIEEKWRAILVAASWVICVAGTFYKPGAVWIFLFGLVVFLAWLESTCRLANK